MRKSFEVSASTRDDQGKGASRRLRRTGKVPAILYGGKGEPSNITLDQLKLLNVITDEKFYSSVVTLKLDGTDHQAIVKDVQMHPAKNQVLHVDLQRVLADQLIRLHLPIHFLNETTCPGVKVQGGLVSHLRTDVEISCLPKDLPEALEVDMAGMSLGDTVYLSQGREVPVVTIHAPRTEEPEAAAAETAAVPTAGDAKKAADAKAGDAKAGDAKAADAKGGKK
jgi:large subunit ribosomal protein L25